MDPYLWDFVRDAVYTLADLQAAIAQGTRICRKHLPMILSERTHEKVRQFCVLRLPQSLEVFEESKRNDTGFGLVVNAFGGLHLPGYYAGHVRIYLREDPEVAKFAEQIGHKANPELSPDSVEMMFVKLDIVKFTEIPVELQPRAIAELHFIVSDSFKDDLSFRAGLAGENPAGWHPSGVLHTGDGFILPFRIPDEESLHRSPKPRAYARDIAQALDAANSQRYPIRFRISVTCGKVYVTGDLSGKRNYVGEAITESERLLSYIPKTMDDVVVFSDTVYRKFYSAFKNGEFQFFRFGTITDKHKVGHRLYLLDYLD